VAGCLVVLGACTYHNVLHNAGRLYRQAETDRRAGRAEAAHTAYAEVAKRTGTAVRDRPHADWSDDALLLFARAELRLGAYAEAEAALIEALGRGPAPERVAEIEVYRAMLDERTGDRERALSRITSLIESGGTPMEYSALVEAHLLRGRLLLAKGETEGGWRALDEAVALASDVRAEAGLERLRWGVALHDSARSRRALEGLLSDPAANVRVDTVSTLADGAYRSWGAASAARMLAGVDSSAWDRVARGRITLQRARYLDEAGDTAAATGIVVDVSRGLGRPAAEARLLLANWRSARARDLSELYALRSLLLPAASDTAVSRRLAAIGDLERLAELGLDEPLAWFAAAEVARDRLTAPVVARGLFLAYGDQAPQEPWAPKALLAALEAAPDEGDRSWILGRLEAYADSPYVLAARGGPSAGFTELDEELDMRLRDLIRE
jgi:tetratricopeptide (TPR) repeat protein